MKVIGGILNTATISSYSWQLNSSQFLHNACAGWALHYPAIAESERVVRHLDVGMGFGGLTVALAELFPEKLVLGMEIRAKVEY